MKSTFLAGLCAFVSTAVLAPAALAVVPTQSVPEIDGGMATLALALTLGATALIREQRRRK